MEPKPKLSERIAEAKYWDVEAATEGLRTFDAEVADLEAREVPKGWVISELHHPEKNLTILGLAKSKPPRYVVSHGSSLPLAAHRDFPGDGWTDWRGAIAAAEAAKAKEETP